MTIICLFILKNYVYITSYIFYGKENLKIQRDARFETY